MKHTLINFRPHPSHTNNNTLMWALMGSLMLHTLIAVVMPKFATDAPKQETLVVELIQQAPPPPPPPPLPEPVKPEPIKPKPPIKPMVKPLPIPTETKNDPTPPPPPEVIAVAPQVDAPPPPIPPVAIVPHDPPKPVIPVDTSAARDNYDSALWAAIVKHKQYPRIAQMRGWQGEAVVELLLDGNGKLKAKKIIQSSGHEVLDKQALDMVEKAMPFPTPPEVLRGSSFSIKVPIAFKLE